jgi:hypothetical protein
LTSRWPAPFRPAAHRLLGQAAEELARRLEVDMCNLMLTHDHVNRHGAFARLELVLAGTGYEPVDVALRGYLGCHDA